MKRLVAAVMLGIVLVACDDPEAKVAGRYQLVAINGTALPGEAEFYYITAGTLDLESDHTLSVSLTLCGTPSAEQGTCEVFTDEGTWRYERHILTFVDVGSRSITGLHDDGTIVMGDEELRLTFRR